MNQINLSMVDTTQPQRIICWFSCGAASATATKLALEQNNASPEPKELVIASIYLKDEHPDSKRFLKDCEKWFGQRIVILKNKKYKASVDEVIKQTKYMTGIYGARCTKELKKQVRYGFQRDNDIHVFGMTVNEQTRIDNLLDHENELEVWPILIENELTKNDCFELVTAAGITLPTMYLLGFNNNNCIGCLKAQSPTYWNKIRQHFPKIFIKRAHQEQLLNVALCKMSINKFINTYPDEFEIMFKDFKAGKCSMKIDSHGNLRIPLRYLPKAENTGSADVGDCGFFCEK